MSILLKETSFSLGHLISQQGIQLLPEKVTMIKKLKKQ